MAQALFDAEHPLHHYLRDHGDVTDRTIPGGLDNFPEPDDSDLSVDVSFVTMLNSLLSATHELISPTASPNREFAERFKYIVISSSVLSSTIATPTASASPSPDTSLDIIPEPPGTWEVDKEQFPVIKSTKNIDPNMNWIIPLVALATIASHSTTVLIAASSWFLKTYYNPSEPKSSPQLQVVLDSLQSLIRASDSWDAVVNNIMTILEDEEVMGTSHPASLSLRSALQSACESTHAQADNIRHLFSPLTAPLELSMLSEMYAPSSPSTSRLEHTQDIRRSSATMRSKHIPNAGDLSGLSKRSTWNGPARSRHTPLRSLFDSEAEASSSEGRHPLAQTNSPPTPTATNFASDVEGESFGATALSIQRRHRRQLVNGVRGHHRPWTAPSPQSADARFESFSHALSRSPLTSPASPSSRLRALNGGRRPQSLGSLRSSVQNAVSSRRYAASHLLALRFEEDGNDPYWEDVTSIINLLTNALDDAVASLSEALDESVRVRLAEQVPTPPIRPTIPTGSRRSSGIPPLPSMQLASFAPMPTQLATFANHMDVMTHAMECAKEELRACLAALQTPPNSPGTVADGIGNSNAVDTDALRNSIIESYGRLRRGLGAAVRECERGREPLYAALHVDDPRNEDDADDEDVPESANSSFSHEAAPHDAVSRASAGSPPSPTYSRSSVVFTPELESGENRNVDVFDDAGSRLLDLTDPFHVPPDGHGPEQVFEAAVVQEIPLFDRERSKLTREERIQLAKERRASGKSVLPPTAPKGHEGDPGIGGGYSEAWGPGGDVVQELKSVINLVGEKRRRAFTRFSSEEGSSRKSMSSLASVSEKDRPPVPNRPPPPTLSPPPFPSAPSTVEMSPEPKSPLLPYLAGSGGTTPTTSTMPPLPSRPSRPQRRLPPLPPIPSGDVEVLKAAASTLESISP